MGTVYCFYILIYFSAVIGSGRANDDKCGKLSITEPKIKGRNVTFEFRPNVYFENSTLEWQRRKNSVLPWERFSHEQDRFIQYEENKRFYFILMMSEDKDEASYRVKYYNDTSNCTMAGQNLTLIDNSEQDCGFLYLKTSVIVIGQTIEIEYYPKESVINYPRIYHRTWKRETSSSNETLTLTPGVYEEHKMSESLYVLTIFTNGAQNDTKKDGVYYVQCYHDNDNEFISANVTIALPGRANNDKCGLLRIISKPKIKGRNVTFEFRPNVYFENSTLEWQRRENIVIPWQRLSPEQNRFIQYEENKTFYFTLMASDSTDEAIYRVKYYNDTSNCTVAGKNLTFIDSCGFLYLKTSVIVIGQTIEIEYYPTENEIRYPHIYNRTWKRVSKTTNETLTLTPGVYEEHKMSESLYVLTIFTNGAQNDTKKDGVYYVQCYHGKDMEYISANVTITLPVPPQDLELLVLRTIDDREYFIVDGKKENVTVFCQFYGGSYPITLNFSIGNETWSNTLHYRPNVWRPRIASISVPLKRLKKYHNANITCSLKNDALSEPKTTTARVYVIESPKIPNIIAPDFIKEGDDWNVSCTFVGGRPLPKLYLKYSGVRLPNTKQNDTFISTNQTYTSVITLKNFQKDWSNKITECCRESEWYSPRCYQIKRPTYLFPPSKIRLQVIPLSDTRNRMFAVCTIHDSNPPCMAILLAPQGSVTEQVHVENFSKAFGQWDSTTVFIWVGESVNYTGENLRCLADCPYFPTSMESSYSLTNSSKEPRHPSAVKSTCYTIVIVLVVVASVIVVVVIAVLTFVWLRRRQNLPDMCCKTGANATDDQGQSDPPGSERNYGELPSRSSEHIYNRVYYTSVEHERNGANDNKVEPVDGNYAGVYYELI